MCKFFFNDYRLKAFAPETLIMEFVTKLGMEMYLPGEDILVPGKKVNALRIIGKGSCILWGMDDRSQIEYKICKLPKMSWYGDFNVFLHLKTTFRL